MLRLIKHKFIQFKSFSTSPPRLPVPGTFPRFAQFVTSNKTLFQDAIHKQNQDNPNLKMVALEFKDQFGQGMWPSFDQVVQRPENLPYLYFHRYDQYDQRRYEETIEYLKGKPFDSFVGWFGNPGIGKSTGMNYILYHMLANLGSPGYPSVVYYRIPCEIIIFSKQINDQDIQVTSPSYISFGKLHEFIRKNDQKFHGTEESKGKSCLILDLLDGEIDPVLNIPTFLTLSTSDADMTMLTLNKGGLQLYTVGPPTHEQIVFMEWTRYLHGDDLWYLGDKRIVGDVDDDTDNDDSDVVDVDVDDHDDNDTNKRKEQLLGPPNNKTKKLFDKVIQKMLSVVGPVPRAIASQDTYYELKRHISGSRYLDWAIKFSHEIHDYHAPELIRYFLATYPKNRSTVDPPDTKLDAPVCRRGLYIWSFLSTTTENSFINAKLTNEENKKLQVSGINYRIAESRVKQYLKKEFEDTWEWFKDVGYDHFLTTSQLIDPIELPKVNSYNLLEDTVFINQPVDTLTANCLYHFGVHNFRVGNFVMVDHEKKVCYYFQVTLGDLKDRPVKLSVLENVMNHLKIVENGYKLHLILVIDKANKLPCGSKFIITNQFEKEMNFETTLLKLKRSKRSSEEWKVLANHIETTIVRATLSYNFDAKLPSQRSISKQMKNNSGTEAVSVAVLKEELRNYNLATHGDKAKLVQRLEEYFINLAMNG